VPFQVTPKGWPSLMMDGDATRLSSNSIRNSHKKRPRRAWKVGMKKGLCFSVAVKSAAAKMDLQPRTLGEAELLRLHVREACLDVLGLHFAFVARGVAGGMERLTIDGL
jgi:hypothetical protein